MAYEVIKKTLSTEIYNVPAPKEVTIGDPYILDKVLQGTASAEDKKMIFSRERIAKSWKARLVYTKELWEGRYCVIAARLCVAHRDYIDAFDRIQYYSGAVLRGYPRDLVCEKASYEISVLHHTPDLNGNTLNLYRVNTGTDGSYGCAYKMIGQYGFSVRFEFPNRDLMSEHQIRELLAYLFRCPEILNNEEEWV